MTEESSVSMLIWLAGPSSSRATRNCYLRDGKVEREQRSGHEKQIVFDHRRGEVPSSGAEGVIIHQGGAFGGMSLYTKGGKAKFAYNFLVCKLLPRRRPSQFQLVSTR